ncbi:MAG: hypothetical protein QOI72_1445, partial [Solirubrobacterales bacterium]|nr:hypothetical protein [Solirubrobacterales bacterium]
MLIVEDDEGIGAGLRRTFRRQ